MRALFQKLLLPSLASCQESQDICFIPQGGYQEFLWARRGRRGSPGDLVDRQGRILGKHGGVENFTVGQRRGLNTPGREPYYVLQIQPECNRVVIGAKKELLLSGAAGPGDELAHGPSSTRTEVTAVIRYRHPGVQAVLKPQPGDLVEVVFAHPPGRGEPRSGRGFL